MEDILIVTALPTDLEGIVQVVEETFPQDFSYGIGFDKEKCENLFRGAIKDPNEFVVVAKSGEEVIGFAYYINKPPTNGTVLLEMIGIRKDFQGKKIGLKLITEADELVVKYLKEECGIQNLATIHLTTSKDNPAGQKLYLKAGYSHVGDIPGFVGEGNCELVMLKKVADVKYRQGLWNE